MIKKAITVLLIVTLFSFNNEKTYSLKLNEAEFQALWYVIDNSTAPHNTVKQVQDFLSKQYNSQVDTTKKK